MEEMKFFTEEEILDKHIGKIGTPHRNQFEDEINTFQANSNKIYKIGDKVKIRVAGANKALRRIDFEITD